MKSRDTLQETPKTGRTEAPVPIRRLTTEALLAGAREVILEHRGEHYRLRITATGKLILTK